MHTSVYYNQLPIRLSRRGFQSFKKAFKIIKAGGGLVRNLQGEYLLIFRRGQWDLPKGKLELGESIESCALREVREETGVAGLTILKKLPKTYHLYTDSNGKIILKECYWFEMQTHDRKVLEPQHEEGISEAVWLSQSEVELRKHCMFPTIRHCFEFYFSRSNLSFWKRLFRHL